MHGGFDDLLTFNQGFASPSDSNMLRKFNKEKYILEVSEWIKKYPPNNYFFSID